MDVSSSSMTGKLVMGVGLGLERDLFGCRLGMRIVGDDGRAWVCMVVVDDDDGCLFIKRSVNGDV